MSVRLSFLSLLMLLSASALAFAEPPVLDLFIQNQHFTTQELQVPNDTKIKLVVHNQDSIPAEFESYDLSREVVVPRHSSVTVYIGPLSPGRYNFFNDFNHDAQGWVVVAKPVVKPGN